MRLKISRSKNDASYYAIESTYINKKHSSKVVMHLGKESELRKLHDDPESWAREYLKQLTSSKKNHTETTK